MGGYDEALADFSRAIELGPITRGPSAAAARLPEMERYEEALADFNRAIELDPDLRLGIGSRGEIYRLMGRYDEALADLNRAIELDPGYALAIGSRGQTYRHWAARGGDGRPQPRHRARPRLRVGFRRPW